MSTRPAGPCAPRCATATPARPIRHWTATRSWPAPLAGLGAERPALRKPKAGWSRTHRSIPCPKGALTDVESHPIGRGHHADEAARLQARVHRPDPDSLQPVRLRRRGDLSPRHGAVGRRRRLSGGFAGHGENINSSAPAGTSWRARYNNSGPTLGDHFAVEAICAKQPAGYTVAFATADNPAHSQSTTVATCP